MNFRTIADLNRAVAGGLWKIPRDVDLIVGIPRSGLMAASMVALHLHLPLADLDGFLEGRMFGVGLTRRRPWHATRVPDCRKVLVVDDSVRFGRTIEQARERIRAAGIPQQVLYAAVFVDEGSAGLVDFSFECCPNPRMFEWNLMHHRNLRKVCLDIDGVLCRDPTPEDNDDGPRYAEFLRDGAPLYLPTSDVGVLVTCRLEKYRAQTEDRLRRHGVRYGKLVMMDLPSKEARVALGGHGSFKAKAYVDSGKDLFVESSPRQAAEIASKSGKPVFCLGDHRLYRPPARSDAARLRSRLRWKLERSVREALSRAYAMGRRAAAH